MKTNYVEIGSDNQASRTEHPDCETSPDMESQQGGVSLNNKSISKELKDRGGNWGSPRPWQKKASHKSFRRKEKIRDKYICEA